MHVHVGTCNELFDQKLLASYSHVLTLTMFRRDVLPCDHSSANR